MKMKHTIDEIEYLFQFELTRINTIQFSIAQTDLTEKEPPKGFPVKLDFSVATAFNIKNKISKIGIELKCAFENNPKFNATLKTDYIFKIENLEDFLIEGNTLKIPDYFTIAMVGIALSTTRGIWFEKTAGTLLNKVMFPIVDPSKLIDDVSKNHIETK